MALFTTLNKLIFTSFYISASRRISLLKVGGRVGGGGGGGGGGDQTGMHRLYGYLLHLRKLRMHSSIYVEWIMWIVQSKGLGIFLYSRWWSP